MAILSVRRLDPVTFEPQYGNGQADFIYDMEALVQILTCELRLYQGEWFLNLNDGLPMFKVNPGVNQILGGSANPKNLQSFINLISARINQNQWVTGIQSVNASYENRQLSYSAVINTVFGTVTVTNSSGSAATITSST